MKDCEKKDCEKCEIQIKELSEKLLQVEQKWQEAEKKLEEQALKFKEKIEDFLYTIAETDNKFKLAQKDGIRLKERAIEKIVCDLTPLIYSLKQAKETLDENGIQMIIENLYKILNSNGVNLIKTKIGDEFDHNIHEAISSCEHESIASGAIVQIVKDGFKYGEKVIQPTAVITAI